MATPLHALALAVALAAPGGGPGWFGRATTHTHHTPPPAHGHAHGGHAHAGGCSACQPGGRIVADGPGYGWGFKNDNPDGYGYVDYGDALPLGGNRTPEYFFDRQYTVTPQAMFFPTYYNPYLMRGQRYVPYVGGGGDHPFGGMPTGNAEVPNWQEPQTQPQPVVPVPTLTGRTEQMPVSEVLPGSAEPMLDLDVPRPVRPGP